MNIDDMKRLLGNEEGATSVLVIFLMIVLVTLGTFAITSANVNFKFANHAGKWQKMYYDLENEAESTTQQIDEIAVESINRSAVYVQNRLFTQDEVEGISTETQQRINQFYTGAVDKEVAINKVLQMVYFEYLQQALTQRQIEAIEEVKINSENELVSSIVVKSQFVHPEQNDYHLTVVLELGDLSNYKAQIKAGTINIVRTNSNPRFEVLQWNQWQTPVEIEQTQELWDGMSMPSNPDVLEGEDIFAEPTQ